MFTDDDEELKNHFKYFHLINKDNYYFKELLTKDFENKYSKICEEWDLIFDTCRKKTNHCLLLHYKKSGGSNIRPLNILRRSNVITNGSTNYSTHKSHYDFFDAEKTVKDFISAINSTFSKGKVKV